MYDICTYIEKRLRCHDSRTTDGNFGLTSHSILKPDSHRKIVKDYRPKTGKDHEFLRESVQSFESFFKGFQPDALKISSSLPAFDL